MSMGVGGAALPATQEYGLVGILPSVSRFQ